MHIECLFPSSQNLNQKLDCRTINLYCFHRELVEGGLNQNHCVLLFTHVSMGVTASCGLFILRSEHVIFHLSNSEKWLFD